MKTLVIFITIFNFILFIVGAFTVFAQPKNGGRFRSLSSILIILCMSFLLVWVTKTDSILVQNLASGILLNLTSICLFFYTAKSLRSVQLSPIFSIDKPTTLILHGPYRFIRHPFYTSYLLAFSAAALYINSLLAWTVVLVIYIVYLRASEQEESKFFNSDLKDEYLTYMQGVGRFLPKPFSHL